MNIELKHLAPYLPYELRYLSPKYKAKHIMDIDKDETIEVMGVVSLVAMTKNESSYYKPLLRPLSDLTKDIELNGGIFVPMVRLMNMIGVTDLPKKYYSKHGIHYIEWGSDNIMRELSFEEQTGSFYYTHNGIEGAISPQLEMFQKLFEWHFDVFKLIDKGLALDINTIKI